MSAFKPIIYDRPFDYRPPELGPQLIHTCAQFYCVDKPAGLLSVPGKAQSHKDCVESRLKVLDPEARIVHRLDMATSGVMIMVRNSAAHRHIGLQFERRHLRKRYEALVWGRVEDMAGQIDLPLRCDWPNRPVQMVDEARGKKAITDWQVIGHERLCGHVVTRMALTPITGRSHQLRVHMLALGHPIVGDQLYAPDEAFTIASRLMLHALWIEFHHPDGGERVSFKAVCPF